MVLMDFVVDNLHHRDRWVRRTLKGKRDVPDFLITLRGRLFSLQSSITLSGWRQNNRLDGRVNLQGNRAPSGDGGGDHFPIEIPIKVKKKVPRSQSKNKNSFEICEQDALT